MELQQVLLGGPNWCCWEPQLVLLGVLVLLSFLLYSSSFLAKKWYMSLFLYKEL
jgi:hypothetical protein